jgi:DNA-binding CsgD family transcriptional regulator
MHLFSRTLLAIYLESTKGSIHEFQAATVRLLHDSFDFDGVVLGASQFDAIPGMRIISAYIDGRSRSFLDDYLPLLSSDPIMVSLLGGLDHPIQADLDSYYRNRDLSELDSFAHKYNLRKLMAFGDRPCPETPTRWIMLFRDADSEFTSIQQELLGNLWPHLSQATSICNARAVSLRSLAPPCCATALLNKCGEIAFADMRFMQLLRFEWPDSDMPDGVRRVREQLLQTRAFRGRYIDIVMAPGSSLVCLARPTAACRSITPRETLVARRFAAGLSHKEVARELGISPNTVRTQLTHVYAKLQLHDKAALANYLMSQAEVASAELPN